MEQAELIKATRAECGKVTATEELEDEDVVREANWILKRIDERIVDRKLRFFESTNGEREYDVHADTVRVQKVFPSDTQIEELMELGTHHSSDIDPDAEDYYLFPSLYTIRLQRRIRGLPSLKWEWNAIRRKVVIDPHPLQDGDKYWYISVERANWTLENVPDDFEELLVTGTAWKCIEIVLLKRSDLGGIIREGGYTDYPAPAMREFITGKKDEFFSLLNLKAQLYGSK